MFNRFHETYEKVMEIARPATFGLLIKKSISDVIIEIDFHYN